MRADKAAHDRLLAKAYAFCASIAAKYPSKPPDGASAAASGTESTTETGLPGSVECVRSASATSAGRPIYTARIEWHTQMYKGAPMSATADAVGVGTVKFTVPTQGASFTLQLSLPPTVVAERLVLRDLRLLVPPTPAATAWSAPTSAPPAMSDSAPPEPSVEAPAQIEDELEAATTEATARAIGPNPPPATTTATVIASAPAAPISLPVSLIAVYAPSSKAPAGKRFYNVDVDWNDDLMYPRANLSIHIPPLSTTTTVVLPANKPAGGAFKLQLRLPASMTEDRFALGAAVIVSGPKPVQAVLQGGGVPSKRAGGGQKQPRKKAMPAEPPAPEPDFALPGYTVQPLPAELTIEALRGRLVAHRFSTSDWPPGWCVGVVDAKSEAKRTRGLYEVNYGKQFRPAVYLHQLQPAEHGPTGNWCLVAKR